jgi:hypothetical protein
MFTMSSTVDSFGSAATGRARPSKIGPTADAPPSTFSVWYAALPAASEPNTSTFALRAQQMRREQLRA